MSLHRKQTTATGRKNATIPKGFGAQSQITVKGKRATLRQRTTLDSVLTEAHSLGASARVMQAAVMTVTQESVAGERTGATNGDDQGPFQQGREWISAANSSDAGKATRAFLLGSEANVGGTGNVKGWKQRHGSLKHAPGDLNAAIVAVQISVGGYGQWADEAARTVKAWQGSDGLGTVTVAHRFEFTRGERNGTREDTWQATERLASERGFRRWAAGNVFYFVSEDELRAAKPSVEIHGDEGWLLALPEWEWGSGRPVNRVTLRVAADRWSVMPGGVVMLHLGGPVSGRWLVESVSGESLDSPVQAVVLKRPTAHKPEPAHDTSSRSSGGSASSDSGVVAAASEISAQGRNYRYGGGHGKPLAKITDSEPLDCSSSVCLALKRAGMFDGSQAVTSGELAASWGQPGKGRDFTVWANGSHVWVEFHSSGRYKRFDTSPWGSGERGPRVRETQRTDQSRFTARHWA